MKTKFFLSFFAVVFLFSACNKSEDVINDLPSDGVELVNSKIVSQDQVVDFVGKAVLAIYDNKELPLTRSASASEVPQPKAVTPIYSKSGMLTMYSVNFGNNEGYMIVSADKEAANPIIAFSDMGFFDYQTLDKRSPMSLWIEEQKVKIERELKLTADPTKQAYDLWNNLGKDANKDVEVTVRLVTTSRDKNTREKRRHRNSYNLADVRPSAAIVNGIWGQGAGYNADAKVKGALAGCPSIAIGLLCRALEFPTKYDYAAMPNYLKTTESNAISRMLRDIADHIPNYMWGVQASGAAPNDIFIGLQKLGYKDVVLENFNFKKAYENIENGYPVLLAGYQFFGGGHIWNCDGYWEQVWDFSLKFRGKVYREWYEYSDMLYMNWGWDGNGNGWVDQQDWPDFSRGRVMFHNLVPDTK